MSKRKPGLKGLLQVLFSPLMRLLRKLQSFGNPHKQLARTCETLQQQLGTSQARDKVWQTYTRALSLARKCDRHELTQVIFKFDPLLGQSPSDGVAIGQARSFLLEAKPQTAQNLDAAWRLSQRLHPPSSIQEAGWYHVSQRKT